MVDRETPNPRPINSKTTNAIGNRATHFGTPNANRKRQTRDTPYQPSTTPGKMNARQAVPTIDNAGRVRRRRTEARSIAEGNAIPHDNSKPARPSRSNEPFNHRPGGRQSPKRAKHYTGATSLAWSIGKRQTPDQSIRIRRTPGKPNQPSTTSGKMNARQAIPTIDNAGKVRRRRTNASSPRRASARYAEGGPKHEA